MILPWFTASTSTVRFSHGSMRWPSISFTTTRGLPTATS